MAGQHLLLAACWRAKEPEKAGLQCTHGLLRAARPRSSKFYFPSPRPVRWVLAMEVGSAKKPLHKLAMKGVLPFMIA